MSKDIDFIISKIEYIAYNECDTKACIEHLNNMTINELAILYDNEMLDTYLNEIKKVIILDIQKHKKMKEI